MIHEPLTKLQCSPTSDGAAAALVASERFVEEHGLWEQAIEIAGQAMVTDLSSTFDDTADCIKIVGADMTRKAAQQAYEEAQLGPEDVQVIELHDCFSANELITYEALGLCGEGEGHKLVEGEATTYGGRWVVNPSGGLISKGHPLGATGLAQCSELTWQLRGKAEARQVDGAKAALQHNIGLGGAAVVTVYRAAWPREADDLRRRAPRLPRVAYGASCRRGGAPSRGVGAGGDRPARAVRQGRAAGAARDGGPGGVWRSGRGGLPLQPDPRRGGRLAGVAGSGLGITLHNDICLPYFLAYCDEEQRARWLPGIADGALITALAMTEPGIGSDLAAMSTSARREDDHYVVNGAKTFITNGINADLVIVAVKTDPSERHTRDLAAGGGARHGGLRARAQAGEDRHARAGHRGAVLQRRAGAGRESAGGGGAGVSAISSPTSPRSACRSRLRAWPPRRRRSMDARLRARSARRSASRWAPSRPRASRWRRSRPRSSWRRVYVDQAVLALVRGELSAEDAAMAKWWCTELQGRVVDRCVQLHGGYGYMLEYPIARAYADARVTRIYGGTNEIMKEIIGRSLGV